MQYDISSSNSLKSAFVVGRVNSTKRNRVYIHLHGVVAIVLRPLPRRANAWYPSNLDSWWWSRKVWKCVVAVKVLIWYLGSRMQERRLWYISRKKYNIPRWTIDTILGMTELVHKKLGFDTFHSEEYLPEAWQEGSRIAQIAFPGQEASLCSMSGYGVKIVYTGAVETACTGPCCPAPLFIK